MITYSSFEDYIDNEKVKFKKDLYNIIDSSLNDYSFNILKCLYNTIVEYSFDPLLMVVWGLDRGIDFDIDIYEDEDRYCENEDDNDDNNDDNKNRKNVKLQQLSYNNDIPEWFRHAVDNCIIPFKKSANSDDDVKLSSANKVNNKYNKNKSKETNLNNKHCVDDCDDEPKYCICTNAPTTPYTKGMWIIKQYDNKPSYDSIIGLFVIMNRLCAMKITYDGIWSSFADFDLIMANPPTTFYLPNIRFSIVKSKSELDKKIYERLDFSSLKILP